MIQRGTWTNEECVNEECVRKTMHYQPRHEWIDENGLRVMEWYSGTSRTRLVTGKVINDYYYERYFEPCCYRVLVDDEGSVVATEWDGLGCF